MLAPEKLDRPLSDSLFSELFPPLATGVHWGLERTEAALEALDQPHRRYPSIHIGGTNGKGSVASMVSAALSQAGQRAACFTSPHLCSFRERFTIRGRALSEAVLRARADEIRDVVVDQGLTFFEAITVLAFHAFARAEVDIAVVEVGLGGRLDATNVLTPLVSAVTNVALDHSEYLGDTVEEIAREKAGIIKPGVPFLTTETDPGTLAVLREVHEKVGGGIWVQVDPGGDVAELVVDARHTAFTLQAGRWGELSVDVPLVGRHQAANAALAVEILEHLPPEFRPDTASVLEGIAHVRHPGRDQVEVLDGRTWLFDVAHNTAGVESLADTLDRVGLPSPRVGLVGVLGDKDWASMLPPLYRALDAVVLTQAPTAPEGRRWDPEAVLKSVAPGIPAEVEVDFPTALRRARERAGEGTVVVTGSCHTVGSALTLLKLEPLSEG